MRRELELKDLAFGSILLQGVSTSQHLLDIDAEVQKLSGIDISKIEHLHISLIGAAGAGNLTTLSWRAQRD
ncbi:MAG TPA: hypothetical protein VGM27_12420 [Acidobacteriaceae bacterium]